MKYFFVFRQSIAILIVTATIFGCTTPSSLTKETEIFSPNQINQLALPEIDDKLRNPWTTELEEQFQERAQQIINYYANWKSYGNNHQENEKRSYPRAMFDFLAGNRQKAIAFLQREDPQAKEHEHTEGIDYYYSFTLKGQIRKYFLFGQFLDPAYKKRMFEGAKKWTKTDPLTTPHPIHGMGEGTGKDWSIRRRGKQVDGRNTDNLRAMRETSVYLMAEETGNEETRQIYKEKIQRYVWALYHIGMGEWDSEVYHGHTFAPYLNLYDFAKDPEVKQLAKAALDWLSMAAAIKYYRGGWGGPVKRDYGGGNVALGSSSARTFWLYFGDSPLPNSRPEEDSLFMVTSTYRPPLAVMALARKNFKKPVEILSTKPLYENWKLGNDIEPGYWETQFFGNSYQMGSLAGKFADGDVAPFKLMADNSQRGVDYFIANTGNNWLKPGKMPGDQIGQYRNLLIWLSPSLNRSFFFQLPQTAKAEIEDNIWFFKLEKTWLAIHPINLNNYRILPIKNNKNFKNQKMIKAETIANNYSGFALEVGETESHGTYQQFKEQVKRKTKVELQQLEKRKVIFRGSQGKTLELTYSLVNLLPIIIRDGVLHQWSNNFNLYNSQTADKSPIFLGWKEGKLQIKAGGYEFTTQVTEKGNIE
ncbi:conserved hypothetical protein [Rippkaea orientalis PCC 8801]|uniref:Uncharacterized protein n=1 Tax=Rippkaea orientalis (strain PCC 8801 / RF-1) TaxID=41431 RepID=B7JUZ2_RIPO1|nr:hypothetical protein [Rippkaea orientalis]ACK66844.1 conserved hypothetical protein [Rippkaea orientalis PCC 8801]